MFLSSAASFSCSSGFKFDLVFLANLILESPLCHHRQEAHTCLQGASQPTLFAVLFHSFATASFPAFLFYLD